MKKKKQKRGLILVIVALIFILIGCIYFMFPDKERKREYTSDEVYFKIENDKYINNSEELNSDKKYEGLVLDDIEFSYDKNRNETNISFNATNKSNKAFKEESVLLSFVNKKGTIVNTMFAFIPDLDKNESEKVYGTISGNIVDAYDMIIEEWED